jgi:hypothetical protein
MFSWAQNFPESRPKVTPGIQSFRIEREMRLPRPVRRLRKMASATSAPAAANSAPPMISTALSSGLEDSGGGATRFVDVIELDGGLGTRFVGVTGAELVGANELAGGAGAAFVRTAGAGFVGGGGAIGLLGATKLVGADELADGAGAAFV